MTATLSYLATVVICVASVGTSPNSAFARSLATVFVQKGGESDYPSFELYNAVCTEVERHECGVARFICGEHGGLSFDMVGFSDQDLGKWFSMNGATAILKSGPNVLPMAPFRLETDDLSGTWFVTFLPSGNDLVWLRAISDSPRELTVTTIQDEMKVPDGPKDKSNFESFLSACLAGKN